MSERGQKEENRKTGQEGSSTISTIYQKRIVLTTNQVQLYLDVVSESFHCNPSYCH